MAGRVLAVLLGAALLPLAGATTPAQALTQYCGRTAVGVGNDYAAGSLDNGHPQGELAEPRHLNGWGGLQAQAKAEETLLIAESVLTGVQAPAEFLEAAPYEAPKSALVALEVAVAVAAGIREAAESALLVVRQQNARVNACSGTLSADLTDVIFTAMLEEELAQLDPAGATTGSDGSSLPPGARLAPSAMFLLPDDGLPSWQRDATRYGTYGGHDDRDLSYQDGFVNAVDVGVAELVRNQIAHLEAHGISTGGSRTYDPRTRQYVTVPGAKDEWALAMGELRTGDLRSAYALFAKAYQLAVQTTTVP